MKTVLGRERRRTLLKQGSGSIFTIVFLASFTVAKLFSMAFNKIFTNQLPQESMGNYAVILTASTTLMTFTAIGFPTALSRYTVAYKSKNKIKDLQDLVFSGVVMFISIETLIVMVLIILYYTLHYTPWFLNFEPYLIALLAIAGIVIMQLFSTLCYNIASSLQNNRFYSIPIIMRVLLQIPFGFLFAIFLQMDVFGLIIGLFLSEATVGLYSLIVIIRDLGIGKFSFKKIKSIFSYSSPVYVSNMLMRLFDLFILFYIEYIFMESGEKIIAVYRYGALAVVNLLLILTSMFRTVYRPIIFKHFEKQNYSVLQDLSSTTFRLYVFSIIPLGFLMYGFSPLLIRLFANNDYVIGFLVIPLLLFALFFEQVRTIIAYGHALYYKNYWILVASIPAMITAIITSIYAIPQYGLIGIGIVYFTLRFVQFIIQFIISQRYFKLNLKLTLLTKILVLTATSIGVFVFLQLFLLSFLESETRMIVSSIISTFTFLILAIVFKLQTKRDLAFIKQQILFYRSLRNSIIQKNSTK